MARGGLFSPLPKGTTQRLSFAKKDNIIGDGGKRKSQVGGQTEPNGASNPNEILSNLDQVEHYMLLAGERIRLHRR
jgi:hypothetical protein